MYICMRNTWILKEIAYIYISGTIYFFLIKRKIMQFISYEVVNASFNIYGKLLIVNPN